MRIDTVEIDPAIAHVAKDWFECPQDGQIQNHIADGLQFIKDLESKGIKIM